MKARYREPLLMTLVAAFFFLRRRCRRAIRKQYDDYGRVIGEAKIKAIELWRCGGSRVRGDVTAPGPEETGIGRYFTSLLV